MYTATGVAVTRSSEHLILILILAFFVCSVPEDDWDEAS